jgi:hypothetical protein
MAMVDEDQTDAVNRPSLINSATCTSGFLKNISSTFRDIDAFCIHDDWGSQKETFFFARKRRRR